MSESPPESHTLSPSILSELEKLLPILLPALITLLSRLAGARLTGNGTSATDVESTMRIDRGQANTQNAPDARSSQSFSTRE